METFLAGSDAVIAILRTALLSIAVVFGAICVLDWAVRTRKISPFNAVARFCRSTVDPILSPIERRVVRAGGTPAAAPLWALVGRYRRDIAVNAGRHGAAGSGQINA